MEWDRMPNFTMTLFYVARLTRNLWAVMYLLALVRLRHDHSWHERYCMNMSIHSHTKPLSIIGDQPKSSWFTSWSLKKYTVLPSTRHCYELDKMEQKRERLIYKNATRSNLQRGPAQRGKLRKCRTLLGCYMRRLLRWRWLWWGVQQAAESRFQFGRYLLSKQCDFSLLTRLWETLTNE
jgi:hypothetical protein